MNAYYFSTGLCMGACHTWARWAVTTPPGFWYLAGRGDFTKSGFAVIDDYGSLVPVEVSE